MYVLNKMSRQINFGPDSSASEPTTIELTAGSGVYQSPLECKYIEVEAVGGGGGGAKNNLTNTPGGGGGGGGYFKKRYPAGSYNYTVGSLGLGYSTPGTNGQSGTATIFGTDSAGGGGRGQLTISGSGGTVTAPGAIITLRGGEGSIGPSEFTSSGGSSFFNTGPPFFRMTDLASTTKLNGIRGSGGAGVGDGQTKGGNAGAGFILITEYYQ